MHVSVKVRPIKRAVKVICHCMELMDKASNILCCTLQKKVSRYDFMAL